MHPHMFNDRKVIYVSKSKKSKETLFQVGTVKQ